MLAVFEGFAVIAGVILVGFVLGRSEVLGPNGQQVIAKLVFYAGTPTLLYVTVADTDLGLIFNTALLATGGSALIVGVFAVRPHPIHPKTRHRRGDVLGLGRQLRQHRQPRHPDCGLRPPRHRICRSRAAVPAAILAPIGMAVLDAAGKKKHNQRWYSGVLQILKNPIVLGAAAG